MGGVSKHMNHIWEDMDLTFGDIKEIFTKVASGQTEAFEKVDGINTHFTVATNGDVRFSRNKGEIKRGGLNLRDTKIHFYNHPAEKQFVEGSTAICEFMKECWWPLGFSKKNWVNCEIIHAEEPQTIHYSKSCVVLHEAVAFDHFGSKTKINLSSKFSKLVNGIDGSTARDSWVIRGPLRISLPNRSGDGVLSEALRGLNQIMNAANLNEDNTLKDYFRLALMKGPVESLRVSSSKKKQIISLVMEEGKLRLIDIKKGLSPSAAKAVSNLAAKKNRGNLTTEVMSPIEFVITRFGAKILDGICSNLIENQLHETSRLAAALDTARSLVETTVDGHETARRQLIERYESKLDAIGIMPPAIEGIVFMHNEQRYKMTGTFALVNQILGISRYGRGKIPPIGEADLISEIAADVAAIKAMGLG